MITCCYCGNAHVFVSIKDAAACPSCGGRYSPEQISALRVELMRAQAAPQVQNPHVFITPPQSFMPPQPPVLQNNTGDIGGFANSAFRAIGVAKLVHVIIGLVIFFIVLGGIIAGIVMAANNNSWLDDRYSEPRFYYDVNGVNASVVPHWFNNPEPVAGMQPNSFYLDISFTIDNMGEVHDFFIMVSAYNQFGHFLFDSNNFYTIHNSNLIFADGRFQRANIPHRIAIEIRNGNRSWEPGVKRYFDVETSATAGWSF